MWKFGTCANELSCCKHWTRREWSSFILMNSPSHPGILGADHGVSRGEKGFIEQPSDTFTWSIVIAFSRLRIYGWMATQDTFTADKMKDFYYSLYSSKINIFKEVEKLPVLVWDNSVIHKSEKIRSFIQKSGVRIITLAPYSPCLNPTEHLIGAIKSRVKNEVFLGR